MCRDTDVLVLLLRFQNQQTPEIWFQAGTALKKKFVAVHEISLSAQHRESLPAFHAITGCDTVSQLSGHGKKTAWKVFQENAKLLDKLGRKSLTKPVVRNAEAFVCKLYSPATDTRSSDKLRCKLFLKGKCEPENLPPTSDAIELYIKRAHHQSSVWVQSTVAKSKINSPVNNGWYMTDDGQLRPLLRRKEPVPTACVDILTCQCKSCATNRCTCRLRHLKCTMACGCAQTSSCQNPLNADTDSDSDTE